MSHQSNVERSVLGYFANLLLFTAAILMYRYNSYYIKFLQEDTRSVLMLLYAAYIVIGLPVAFVAPSGSDSKGLLVVRVAMRFLKQGFRYLAEFPLDRSYPPAITREEKNAILFLIVKFFFLPIMLNFAFQNGNALIDGWKNLGNYTTANDILLLGWYPLIIAGIFFTDTVYFVFGYTVEHEALKNKVRSVEPTLFGWLVAILCYPPFNDVPGYYVGWAANDYATFPTLPLTYALRIAILLCMLIYVWATLALGAKCSNLTNRGIVSRGPYAYIRHPAYVSKNLGWWLSSIPFLMESGRFSFVFFSMGLWSVIYFFRALTEERHLIADPDYQEYCRKVKWRFIPYVF